MANGVASGQKQIKGEKRKKEDSKYKYMRNPIHGSKMAMSTI